MKATPSIHLGGVMIVVIGLITLGFVWWRGAGEAVPTVLSAGNGGSGHRSPVELGVGTDRAAERDVWVAGEVSREDPGRNGLHESLGAALAAARHAVEKIDPEGAHARGAEYFAANPGQQLRAWFSGDGIELASGIPTPEGEEAWNVKLRLAGIGRGTEVAAVEPGVVSGKGSRIEVEHRMEEAGGDTARQELELWNPRDRGRLARSGAGGTPAVPGDHPFGRRFSRKAESSGPAPPADQGSGAPVTQWFENGTDGLEHGFTLEEGPRGEAGDLVLEMAIDGSLRAEAMEDSDRVRFVDAAGAEVLHYVGLKAWDADGLDLPARMEVRGADTLTLLVSDTGARYPVTIDPLFANVEAYLFPEPVAGDRFGNAVAIWENTAVIGAHEDDTMTGSDAGSAYVFVREGTTWSQEVKLAIADGLEWGRFGHSVAIWEDTAVVGAPGTAGLGMGGPGKAYVFVRNGAEWSQQARLDAVGAGPDDELGVSVAIEDQTAVVGAHVFVRSGTAWSLQEKLTTTDGAPLPKGRTVALSGETALVGDYVFVRSGTSWSQEAKLGLGWSPDSYPLHVALWGDTAVVGAPRGDGAAAGYVFVRSGTSWSQEAVLVGDDAPDNYGWPWSAALFEDAAVLGGAHIVGGGRVYVFRRSGASWNQEARILDEFPTHGGEFGSAVAVSRDRALVGVPLDDTDAGIDAGSAYMFVRSGTTWSQEELLITEDGPGDDQFGEAVAVSGETVLVGVARDDTMAGANAGSAYVFGRSESLWHQEAKLLPLDGAAGDYFGRSVALSDGMALVGAPDDDRSGKIGIGSAHMFVRNGVVWSYQSRLTGAAGESGDNFGSAVAVSSGTALVGAPGDDTASGDDSGSVRVFVSDGTHWNPEALLIPDAGSDDVRFGFSLAVSGDTVLVGTPRDHSDPDYLPLAPGSAYVFVRSGTIWSQQARLVARGGGSSDSLGNSVALSGDTALIGAPFDRKGPFEGGYFEEGSAYVFVRDGTTWSLQGKLTAADAEREDNFGDAVALSGEIALVGVPRDETVAGEFAGSAYVYAREGTLWNQEAKLTAGVDASTWDWFGSTVALDGSIAVAGSPYEEINGDDAGRVYVFLLGELPEITFHPVSRTVPLTDPGTPVTFTVEATGDEPMFYEWRKDGAVISGAAGTLVGGTTSHTIPAVTEADAGLYDVLVWNAGGSVTSSPARLAVNALSEFAQVFPGVPPEAEGVVLVNLSPSGTGGAWRFTGEQQWRSSGTVALGLTTGDRVVEFRPVPGYVHPPAETVGVISGGAATVIDRVYYSAGTAGSGGVSVTLKPDALAAPEVPVADRARWRFLGEGDSDWRDSGTIVNDLVPGSYLIECKPVAGRTTPPPASVQVDDGVTAAPILTYSLENASSGSEPVVVPFGVVVSGTDLPYAYVGQIRSDVGASSGFVVKERVVATAGHVVFDDGGLSTVTGLQWLFQRDRGSFEPEPQTPRGFYLFDGYSAQRVAEGTPGSSTPASQELDVAALYFDDPAGRGGFCGFLASDAAVNEWVVSEAEKMLVGYPVEGVPASQVGRMHATSAANLEFTLGGSPHTYTTSGIRSSGGTSGGPLCVQLEGGSYYPAAIYLGGTGQTVIRIIDSEVIRLFDAAEDSAATGSNNTGGGITLTSVTPVATPTDPGILRVTIEPDAARGAGAAWRLVPESSYRMSGSQLAGLNPGSYTMELSPVAGFQAPALQTVSVAGGSLNEITFTYAVEDTELAAWRQSHFGTTENTGDAADGADPDGDGSTNIDEFTAGTDPNDPNDSLRVLTAARVGPGFTVELAGKAGRVYELQLNDDSLEGTWATRASVGPLAADVMLSLTDPVVPPASGYYRVRVSKP